MAVTAKLASCPKCDQPRNDESACPKCGLAADRMVVFGQERDAVVPEVLIAAWDRTLESWDDLARHEEVFRLVAQNDAFAWAAARYRTRAGDPIGDRQLARIRKSTETLLYATASARADKTPKPYRALIAVFLMLIIATAIGVLYAMLRAKAANPDGLSHPAQPGRLSGPN